MADLTIGFSINKLNSCKLKSALHLYSNKCVNLILVLINNSKIHFEIKSVLVLLLSVPTCRVALHHFSISLTLVQMAANLCCPKYVQQSHRKHYASKFGKKYIAQRNCKLLKYLNMKIYHI